MHFFKPKKILLIVISFLLTGMMAFNSTTIDIEPGRPGLKELKNVVNDSFQYYIKQYNVLSAGNDSLINLTEYKISENNRKIEAKKQEEDSLKKEKAIIAGKSVHKAKVTLSEEDRKTLILCDSLIKEKEGDIWLLQRTNVYYVNLKQQLLKMVENKKRVLGLYFQRIWNYTSSLQGSTSVIFRNVMYHIFVANLDSHELRMHLFNPNDSNKNFLTLEDLKKYLETQKLNPLVLMNAGMFRDNYEPEGLYIENNSKTFFVLDTGEARPNANFYLKPNGVFYLDTMNIPHIDTTEKVMRFTAGEKKKIKMATQSGPMLVVNGKIHKAFMPESGNRKIRSGVGLIRGNTKKVVLAITMEESNFYDFALFFRDIFNSDNALFLDGAISQMYLPDIAPNELGGNFGPMISVTKKGKR